MLPHVDISASVKLLDGGGAVLRQRGSFSGAPLGPGTVTLRTTVGAGDGATFSFDMVNRRGKVHGAGTAALTFKGGSVYYRGSARFVSGTGAFAGMRIDHLRLTGSGPISGESFKVRLSG